MKVKLKEDPKEWRKSTLLTLGGVAFLSSVLRWRRVIGAPSWRLVLAGLLMGAVVAWLRPRWFRGYYRISMRAGFWLSQILARAVLIVIFVIFITPFGLILRVLGKDLLRLRRSKQATSYWNPAKKTSPLDQMF
jgi:hypothetical protein